MPDGSTELDASLYPEKGDSYKLQNVQFNSQSTSTLHSIKWARFGLMEFQLTKWEAIRHFNKNYFNKTVWVG